MDLHTARKLEELLAAMIRESSIPVTIPEPDMHHMICYNCGHDLSEIDPMTVTAQWDGDVLYISFACHCERAYEIRLPPEVLAETLEEVCL